MTMCSRCWELWTRCVQQAAPEDHREGCCGSAGYRGGTCHAGKGTDPACGGFTWYLRNLLLVKTSDNIEDVLDVSTENMRQAPGRGTDDRDGYAAQVYSYFL